MRRRREWTDATLQINLPIKLLDEIDALEPPVTEQLRIEWNGNQLRSLPLNRIADTTKQARKVFCMSEHLCTRELRLIHHLLAKPCAVRSHSPELETTGITNLVEFEIRTIAWISAVT